MVCTPWRLAIVWQVCALAAGRTTTASQPARPPRPDGAGPPAPPSDPALSEILYAGPSTKKVLPLIPMHRDVKQQASPSPPKLPLELPHDSKLAEAHAENWANVAAGNVHHVFAGRGPSGSLGVDPATKQRHADRKAAKEGDVKLQSRGGTEVGVDVVSGVTAGRTRHEEVFPRAPRNACLALENLRHTVFVIEAFVGTPAQRFLPLLDTGSTNVWVVRADCESEGCSNSLKYDPARSSTFRSAPADKSYIRTRFVSGFVLGELGSEDFTVGGVTVHNQAFAMLRHIPDKTMNNALKAAHFNGIIGMAFENLMAVKTEPLYKRYLRALQAEPIFSFYYSPHGADSAMLLGGADERLHRGAIRMMPVVPGFYWQVALREVWIGARQVCCDGPAYAVFDTGTAFNSMPHDSFARLVEMFPSVDCAGDEALQRLGALPSIRYVFGNGTEATLRPEQYSFVSGGVCRPAYLQVNVNVLDGPSYLLGSIGFMLHYYTVFQGGENPMALETANVTAAVYHLQPTQLAVGRHRRGVGPGLRGGAADGSVQRRGVGRLPRGGRAQVLRRRFALVRGAVAPGAQQAGPVAAAVVHRRSSAALAPVPPRPLALGVPAARHLAAEGTVHVRRGVDARRPLRGLAQARGRRRAPHPGGATGLAPNVLRELRPHELGVDHVPAVLAPHLPVHVVQVEARDVPAVLVLLRARVVRQNAVVLPEAVLGTRAHQHLEAVERLAVLAVAPPDAQHDVREVVQVPRLVVDQRLRLLGVVLEVVGVLEEVEQREEDRGGGDVVARAHHAVRHAGVEAPRLVHLLPHHVALLAARGAAVLLAEALPRPRLGPPRRPQRRRVDHHRLARRLAARDALPDLLHLGARRELVHLAGPDAPDEGHVGLGGGVLDQVGAQREAAGGHRGRARRRGGDERDLLERVKGVAAPRVLRVRLVGRPARLQLVLRDVLAVVVVDVGGHRVVVAVLHHALLHQLGVELVAVALLVDGLVGLLAGVAVQRHVVDDLLQQPPRDLHADDQALARRDAVLAGREHGRYGLDQVVDFKGRVEPAAEVRVVVDEVVPQIVHNVRDHRVLELAVGLLAQLGRHRLPAQLHVLQRVHHAGGVLVDRVEVHPLGHLVLQRAHELVEQLDQHVHVRVAEVHVLQRLPVVPRPVVADGRQQLLRLLPVLPALHEAGEALLALVALLHLAVVVQQHVGLLVPDGHGHQDGGELALEVEDALGEGGAGELAPTLVGGEYLEVVAVRAVQPHQPRAVGGVEGLPEAPAEVLGLALAHRGELPAPLGHDQHLPQAAVVPELALELDLAVDAGEAVVGVQHVAQLLVLRQPRLQLGELGRRLAFRRGRLALKRERAQPLLELGQDRLVHRVELGHLLGRLEVDLLVVGVVEVLHYERVLGHELDLLLRLAVGVPHDHHHRAQLLLRVRALGALLQVGEGLLERLGGLVGHDPGGDHLAQGDVVLHLQLQEEHDADDLAEVHVVPAALHEGPAVDVADVRPVDGPQNVEAAHGLAEVLHDAVGDQLLLGRQNHRVPHLLAVVVPVHLAVQRRRLARLRVREHAAHRVDLDVRAEGRHELLVDVRAVAPHGVDVRAVPRAAVVHLPEQLLAPASGVGRVVDPVVVVVCVQRLFDEGLVDLDVVVHDVVVVLLEGGLALLHRLVVHHQSIACGSDGSRAGAAHLLEREVGRVEGDEALDHGPLRDGLVENGLRVMAGTDCRRLTSSGKMMISKSPVARRYRSIDLIGALSTLLAMAHMPRVNMRFIFSIV
ncbi:pepsinogen, putative [Babesia caballi]|uniref:Pepsinogen, putative n=1 Tax=Babesia caballi TaxID=5871 RepID=A0AAV4LSE8_BABCB|nr:pepsinogen, putative [Babesia caballi]